MPTTDKYKRFQNTANDMIARWGMNAVLRRSTGDRACKVVITSFNPVERMGQMRNPTDRKVLMSIDGLDVPPDAENDRLVTFLNGTSVVDEVLKIVEPPGKIDMAGETVFYRLTVRK